MSDPIDVWMRGAARYPLLTPAQEVHLATMVRTWLDSPDPTPQQIRAGRRARERMINCNLRLVAKRVFSFRRMISARGGDLSDAMQDAVIGLNRAVELFNPTRGYKFSTYACQWIDQSIRRYIQVSVDAIRRPASAHDTIRRWRYKPADQTAAEFCEQWGLTRERLELELMHHARGSCVSLDQVCRADRDDGASLGDLIADPNSEYDIEQLDHEAAVMRLRAVADADDLALVELSQTTDHKELAELIGCTTRQVGHHLTSAKERLRGHLEQPVAVLPRQNVITLNDHRPVTQTPNGLAALEKLVAPDAPVAEPAAPKRRVRRTKEQLAAARAEKVQQQAPEQISFTVGGIAISAAPDAAVELIRRLAA